MSWALLDPVKSSTDAGMRQQLQRIKVCSCSKAPNVVAHVLYNGLYWFLSTYRCNICCLVCCHNVLQQRLAVNMLLQGVQFALELNSRSRQQGRRHQQGGRLTSSAAVGTWARVVRTEALQQPRMRSPLPHSPRCVPHETQAPSGQRRAVSCRSSSQSPARRTTCSQALLSTGRSR